MREREKIIDLPVFRYHIRVIITDDVAKSRIARTSGLGVYEKGDSDPAACHSGVKGKNWSYLFFHFNPTVGELSHECFHCVWRMMHWIGAEMDNEVVAYHLTYLTDEIWKFAHSDDPTDGMEKQLPDLAAKFEAPNVTEKPPTDAEIEAAFK